MNEPMDEKEYRDARYAEAKNVKTPAELAAFVEKVSNEPHDYGTIIYACCAAMHAAFHTVNASPNGGITGFQAGCLMWEMVRQYGMFGKEGLLRIQDFSNLMYPQYDEKFGARISREWADKLKETAAAKLRELPSSGSSKVRQRMQEIADGRLPEFVSVSDEM